MKDDKCKKQHCCFKAKTKSKEAYHAPKLIKINELISEGERDAKCFQSKIIQDAIEHIYQTPLRLLGKFGEQFKKTKRHLRRNLRRQEKKLNLICSPILF